MVRHASRWNSISLLIVCGLGWAIPANGQSGTANGEWRSRGGNLANTRYSPLDQIDASNFSELEMVWRFKTDNLGPQADYALQATPLMASGVLYSTAGKPAFRRGTRCRHGRAALGVPYRRGETRGGVDAARLRAGRSILDRWPRGADHLRHAWLSADRT